ncbi:hypothetical protein Tco_1266896 [Tanacetum coccineum]
MGFEGIDIEAPNICEFQLCEVGRGATSVKLGLCKQLKTLFLYGSLRIFEIYGTCDLEEIQIDTPNLLLFRYISLDFKQLKGIQSQPYELEHVELGEGKTNDSQFMDGILWCCRPRSLSWTLEFSSIRDKERSHILQYVSAKLLQQEDQGTANIQIKWSFPNNVKIHYSWKSMIPELPNHNKQTLTFIKEEGFCQEEEERKDPVKGLQMFKKKKVLRLRDPLY